MPPKREPGRQQQAFEDLLDPEYQAFLDEEQSKGPRKHLSQRQWKKAKQKLKGKTPGFQMKETGAGSAAKPTDTEQLLEMFGDSIDMGLVNDVYVSNDRSLAKTIDALFSLGVPQPMETEQPVMKAEQPAVKIEQPTAGPSTGATADQPTATHSGNAGEDGGKGPPTSILDLPEDVKLDIWRRLRLKEMSQAARTCKEFAERVHKLRAGMRTLMIPAGLSFSAIKGMVAAYHHASHISLAKCAPQMRHSLDFIRYLGAVVSGQHERASGVPVTSLDLRSCQAMCDSDVESLLDMFDSLEEVHLANCSRLTDAAVRSLARYRRTDDADKESPLQRANSPTGDFHDPLEEHAARQEAAAGSSADAAEGSGADGDEEAGQGGRQVSVQQTVIEEGIARLKEQEKIRWFERFPARIKAGGLRTLTLAGCTLITQRGISPMFHGTTAMKSLEVLDVSRCPSVNERCMLSISKSQNVLNILRANECKGLTRVTLLLPDSNTLENIQIMGCKNLREVTISAPRLKSLNLGSSVTLQHLELRALMLEKLKLHGCHHLSVLLISSSMPHLKDINVYGCISLTDEALERLLLSAPEVEELHASGCLVLTNVSLPDQPKLRWLDVSGCSSLTRILVGSATLQTLKARHCASLTGITLHSIQLQEVAVSNCARLTNIQLPGVETAELHGKRPQDIMGGALCYNVDGCTALSAAMVAKLEALAEKKWRTIM